MEKVINDPHLVIFEVKEITKKTTKSGSTIIKGERFVGEYHPKKSKVFFTDVNGEEWIFTAGESCIIIERI